MEETKAEKYYRILKRLKCPEIAQASPKTFEILFDIPDTREFFNWFIENVDETCLLNDKEKYLEMASRGQVIRDLNKLQHIDKLINSTSNFTNNDSNETEWWEQCDDPDVLEQMLKQKTESYERDLKCHQREKKMHERFKKMANNKLVELKRVESDRDNLLEILEEKEDSLKGIQKLTYQNVQKSKIEFETKYCDEAQLINNVDDLENSCEHVDSLIESERMLSKQIVNSMKLEPSSELSNVSNVPSGQLKAKSEIYFNVYMNVYKAYVDRRLAYRSSESDLNEIKYILENFNSLTDILKEKLVIKENDDKPLIQNKIDSLIEEKQCRTQEIKENIRNLLKQELESYRLRELQCKLVATKRKFISLSLFKKNLDKLGKLLKAVRSRRQFIEDLLKSKIALAESINDVLEEVLDVQAMTMTTATMTAQSLPPLPAQFSSTYLMPTNQSMLVQSPPSKKTTPGGENQFIHILNQLLISTLRKLEQHLNGGESGGGGEFVLKNPISTSFSLNLDTYIDLAERIKAKHANAESLESVFKTALHVINESMRYFYEQDYNKSKYISIDFNFNKLTLTRNAKPLDEKLKILNKETQILAEMLITKIYQILQNYRTQLNENEVLRIQRDFFIYFYTNPKEIDFIVERLNSLA